MEMCMGNYVLGFLLLLLPLLLLGWLMWWWNEIWFVAPLKARCSSLSIKIPPGHLGLPFFGEILPFVWYFKVLRRPDGFINYKRRKYGDKGGVYRSYLFGSPSIIACSPSLCKLVLHAREGFIQEWPTAQAHGSNAVITLQGGPHHSWLKTFLVNAINHPLSLHRVALHLQPSIVADLHSWSQLGQIKVVDQVRKVSLGYMGRYFAKFDPNARQEDLVKVFSGIQQGFRAQPWNFPGTAYHHALKCRKKITNILMEELEKRKHNKSKIPTLDTNSTEDDDNDLMDGLMQLKNEEGKQLSDEQVIDNVLSIIHTGQIAITSVVTWSLYFLAKSPHVLHKLREENMDLSRKKEEEYITYEDILKLQYTNKVIDETLRMANISGFIFRKATEDIEFNGYIIPKGWQVILWLRYLHTDSENYKDPLCFNPDRWNTRPKHGTYFPFGGGVRSCAGNMLARVTLALFLHHLSVSYKWELLNPDAPIKYLSHPVPEDGLEISISKFRSNST